MRQNKPNIQIRLAVPGDAPAIASVLHDSFVEYESAYTPGAFAATTPTSRQIGNRMGEGPVWVALHNNAVVGTVSALPKGEELYIRSMAVLPTARGQGVGALLLECIESFSSAHSYRRLYLSTTPFLTHAIRLYEHFGFRRSDTGLHDLSGTPLFSMVKTLAPPTVGEAHTRVYLVRHGETDWNVEHRFQGQLDVPLSAVGMEQAQAVAGWLAGQEARYAALYSSDLSRAAQTAQAIAERLDLQPIYSQELREIHVGEWQGLLSSEVEARYPGHIAAWYEKVDSFTLPGGESIPDVQRRMHAYFVGIVAGHIGEAIIVVSHGAALAALIAAMHKWDLVDTWHTRRARMGNTGVTVVTLDHTTGEHTLGLINSMSHLTQPTGMASALDPPRGDV